MIKVLYSAAAAVAAAIQFRVLWLDSQMHTEQKATPYILLLLLPLLLLLAQGVIIKRP